MTSSRIKLQKILKRKTLKTFASLCLISACLIGCTISPKRLLYSKVPSYDSSTPAQYDSRNSGFICFDEKSGNGIITTFARNKYNNLIVKYKVKLLEEKAVTLQADAGLTEFEDGFGNKLFNIDKQHLHYFVLMTSWQKSGL